jgi:hypothetical protein
MLQSSERIYAVQGAWFYENPPLAGTLVWRRADWQYNARHATPKENHK